MHNLNNGNVHPNLVLTSILIHLLTNQNLVFGTKIWSFNFPPEEGSPLEDQNLVSWRFIILAPLSSLAT